MIILEGALTSTTAQDKRIQDFLANFHDAFEKMLYDRERIQLSLFKKLAQKFENRNLSTNNRVKLTVKFVYEDFNKDSGFFSEKVQGKHYEIIMNMHHFIIGLDNMSALISGVDWNWFYGIFIHEYKHFLQVLRAGEHLFGAYSDRDYMDRPHEQQAWAEGYLENLRNLLQTADPVKILDYLKTHELSSNPRLQGLKKTNPSAWKRIMKQAVLAAIRDLNQK